MEGKSVVLSGADLLKDVQESLRALAQSIKNKEKPLGDIDYIVGLSRLGSAAGHFGFDTFPLSDDVAREHQSHTLAEEANRLSGMDEDHAKKQARKRPATLAIMSVKKLVELYGS